MHRRPDTPPAPRRRHRRLLKIGLIAIVVLLLIYYPVGALWVNKIDDDPGFRYRAGRARGAAMPSPWPPP